MLDYLFMIANVSGMVSQADSVAYCLWAMPLVVLRFYFLFNRLLIEDIAL
ncbi:hypothetical protein BC781_1304 [Sediminitomix flava]|uniref:Uncharacterized protein n=1 Tax=Sediminitomix flava TaxID=379075 RepID=A0A315YPZ3_SEDFL|nr:hypothetical protein BC781_1304 [Sediminitomix flava]